MLECKTCNLNALNFRGYSPFTIAIKHSRLEIFRYLLTLDILLNTQITDTLETPLHLACCCESPDFAFAILDDVRYTCSLDTVDKYGDTPLFNACRVGSIEIISKLVAKPECNCLYINHITKETPAHIACRNDRLDILKLILSESFPKSLSLKDVRFNYLGKSLLHIACDNDSEEMIDFLIDNTISAEFNINTVGAVMSPIHIACARGNIGTVTKLLNSGICKITDVDKNRNTVFHYILCTREIISSEMVKVLSMDKECREMMIKKNSAGKNPLHFACNNDAIQKLDCLLRYTDVEQMNTALCSTDSNGNTPFFIGIVQNKTLTLRYLLNTPELADGVSKALCVQNSSSDSPLRMVCYNAKLEYVRLIVGSPYLSEESISAAVCLQDQNGDNVFHNIIHRAATFFWFPYTSRNEFIAVFEALLQCTGNKIKDEVYLSALCMQNNNLITPLQLAMKHETDELLCSIFSSLLKSKLSIASVKTLSSAPLTEISNTLFHLAAQANMFDSVKLLVERQLSSPEILNSYNQTSLHLICTVRRVEYQFNGSLTALYLCEHGLDVHKLDEFGQSPASYAFYNNKSLLQEMISKGYCKLTKIVQSLQWQVDYCLLNTPSRYPNLTIELPLLHLVVFKHGNESREMMEFLTCQQGFSPNVCDSFENTILHLKAFSHAPLSVHMLNLCSSDCLNKQNKEGNTPLHIACASGNKDIVKLLIESERCSESLFKKNIYEHTPLHYAIDRDIINYLILNGADPRDITNSASTRYMAQTFKMLKGRNPLNPTVTVLVLGNSMAGKTTLVKSLTKAYSWEFIEQPSIGQTKDTQALGEMSGRTAGIEISEYKVFEEDEVRILFYDFAGHPEFESTHSVLLQNLISSSEPTAFLFLVVLDITQHDKLTQMMYWAKFIENSESSYAIGMPEVIIIGSHVDRIPEAECEHKSIKISLCKTMELASLKLVENPILLDCRDPKLFELQKVKMLLIRSTKNLIKRADLDIRSHLLFAYLYEHFADKPVKLSVLLKSLKEQKLTGFHVSELLFTRNTLIDLLKGMHYRQHILLIGLDPSSSEADFWVLTAKARSLMFQNVNGLLFASKEFDRHVRIKSNVGILSSSVLKDEFPDLEYNLLHQFLEYSELCKKVTDTEILNLIEGRITDSVELQETESEYSSVQLSTDQSMVVSSENWLIEHVNYFFFPGLVKRQEIYVFGSPVRTTVIMLDGR